MNFKRSILLICIIGFLLETSTIQKVNATHGTQDSAQCKKKSNKKYIRNEHIKKEKDTTPLEKISDSDLDSPDKSNQSSYEGDEDKDTPTISEIHIVLDKPRKENTAKRSVEELNSEKQKHSENPHAGLPSISEYIEKYPMENELKHNRRHTTLANQEMKTSEEESKQETYNVSNSASSMNASASKNESNNELTHTHKHKHVKQEKSKANTKDLAETNKGNEETIYTIAEEIIDQLDALLFEDSDSDKNSNNETDATKRKSQMGTSDLPKIVHGAKKDSSGNDKDVEQFKNKIMDEEIDEPFPDVEPEIKKEVYYPLGTSGKEEQYLKDVKEVNKSFIDAVAINKFVSNGKTKSVNAMNAAKESPSSFLQKESSDMDESTLNENADSENDSEDENSEDGDSEDATGNEETIATSIEAEKIKEDTDLASFDMEEDTDEHNKSKNVDDSSTRKEKKLIRNARKVYKLNLFNCEYINDWDFTKEYVDEQGALVKLSGYVFQNTLNSNSMPTMNITEWKLKGACEYDKYVCGALPYFENIYQKGDRVIFNGKIFEALNDTTTSPQTDDGTWVDKTNECFDS